MANKKDWNKSKPKPKIKKVVIPPGTMLQVKIPADHVPLVVQPTTNLIEIVPAPKAKRSWWWGL